MSSSMSPAAERAHTPDSRSQSPASCGSAEWPYERFPQPPRDGHWIPKFGPPPPSKFPSPFLTAPSNLTLDPPIMELAYPPPAPLSEEDPRWLHKMMDDLDRKRLHIDMSSLAAVAEVRSAIAEVELAGMEGNEVMNKLEGFLHTIAGIAGEGFVCRLLNDVEETVDVMSRPAGNEVDSAGDPGEEESNGAASSSGSVHSPQESPSNDPPAWISGESNHTTP